MALMRLRESKPTKPTKRDEDQQFRVWSWDAIRDGWREVARFCYLLECLDYIGYCQKRGGDVVFQSPTGCRTITPETIFEQSTYTDRG